LLITLVRSLLLPFRGLHERIISAMQSEPSESHRAGTMTFCLWWAAMDIPGGGRCFPVHWDTDLRVVAG